MHRMASNEREEIKRTTKEKMTRRHNKEGGNHLDQKSNKLQRTMEDIDVGLHPAVGGQSLDERRKDEKGRGEGGGGEEREGEKEIEREGGSLSVLC